MKKKASDLPVPKCHCGSEMKFEKDNLGCIWLRCLNKECGSGYGFVERGEEDKLVKDWNRWVKQFLKDKEKSNG